MPSRWRLLRFCVLAVPPGTTAGPPSPAFTAGPKCSGSEVRRRIRSGGLGGGWVESLGEAVEVGAGELPLERLGDLFIAAAERE